MKLENAIEVLNYEASFGLLDRICVVDGMYGLGSRSVSSGPRSGLRVVGS